MGGSPASPDKEVSVMAGTGRHEGRNRKQGTEEELEEAALKESPRRSGSTAL